MYIGTKGWYVDQLKKMGVTKHPIEKRKLEAYKTYVIRAIYIEVKKQYQE